MLYIDYEQPLFSSLIRRARKKKTLASEKWPRENRLAPSFRAAIFRSLIFFFLARRIKLEKRAARSLCCTTRFSLLSLWMKSYSVTIQMKATEQYFPVVLFIMLYKVVFTFESVDKILKCDHSNESY